MIASILISLSMGLSGVGLSGVGLSGVAQAGELQLGVGLRSPATLIDVARGQTKAFSGAKALVRYDLGRVAFEADLHVNPVAQRYTSLDAVLVNIASSSGSDVSFQQPLTNEIVATHLLVTFSPVPLQVLDWGDALKGNLSGGPTALFGVWGARRAEGVLTFEPTAADGVAYNDMGVSYNAGPALGVGIDAWYAGRAGLRLSWLSRWGLEDSPQFDPDQPVAGRELTNNRAVSLDLMVTL